MRVFIYKLPALFFAVLLLFAGTACSTNGQNATDEPEVPYYDREATNTAETVKALKDKPALVFTILTDSHENLQDPESLALVDSTYKNISRVNKLVSSDAIIHLGDFLWHDDIENYRNWDGVNAHLASNISRLRSIGPPVYPIIGNHDGLLGQYVDESKTYDAMYKGEDSRSVHDGRSPWYYCDYPEFKTRVAFLSIPSLDNVTDGYRMYGINVNQMRWIAGTALNVESGWRVLFCGHISPCQPNNGFHASSREVLAGLCKAFQNNSVYENKQWGISVDYSSKSDTKILAYICGHAHADAIVTDNSVFIDYQFVFPVVVIGACNRIVYGNDSDGYVCHLRVPGTVTDDLWDTMVYRPDLKKLFFIRFGSGNDREIDVE